RDRLSDLKRHHTAAVDEAAPPEPSTVDGDRHDREPERPVKRGKARLERRLFAGPDPGSFGIDDDRPAARGDPATLVDQRTKRLRARRPFDGDDAITPRHPAK